MKGVNDFFFVLEKGLKGSLRVRMDKLEIIFNELERFFCLLVLKVKKQVLVVIIVFL